MSETVAPSPKPRRKRAAAKADAPPPAIDTPLFTAALTVRWRDLDAFNHINNARYLKFLEQALIEWFATIGEDWVTDTAAPVVASATLHFKRPIEYPADVFVELFTERLGTTSGNMQGQPGPVAFKRRRGPGQPHAAGAATARRARHR